MGVLAQAILSTTIAGVGGTGLGGLLGACFRRESKKAVSLLLSFAGGVMLSVIFLDLIMGALPSDSMARKSLLPLVLAGLMLGYAIVGMLNALIDGVSRKRANKKIRINTSQLHTPPLFIAGIVMACAIALHNIPEGMVIGASFAGAAQGGLRSDTGPILAAVIGLHDIPEGMAVAVPLIAGGTGRMRAVLAAALSGVPTVLGAVFGYYLGEMGPLMLALSLCFAGGAMLFVVFGELLPEALFLWRSQLPAFAMLTGVLIGLLIVFG